MVAGLGVGTWWWLAGMSIAAVGLYVLAGFALMSAAVSTLWLNIQKPAALLETPAAPAE